MRYEIAPERLTREEALTYLGKMGRYFRPDEAVGWPCRVAKITAVRDPGGAKPPEGRRARVLWTMDIPGLPFTHAGYHSHEVVWSAGALSISPNYYNFLPNSTLGRLELEGGPMLQQLTFDFSFERKE